MATRSTVLITTAPAGSGKTYVRGPRFLCDEFLIDGDGVHYSNFPLYPAKIGEFVEKRAAGKVMAIDVEKRLVTIPEQVFKSWMNEQSGPWDYFSECDLAGCHIAIDECHNVCGSKHSASHRRQWAEWLGEIRHRGATVELISQDPDKIAKEVQFEAGKRLVLMNAEERRDPFFGILMGDWYELRAKFITGKYTAKVWVFERRRVDGRWVVSDRRTFSMEPQYFELYDSYSAPHGGGKKATAPKREFQRRSIPSLLAWFSRRNAWSVGSRGMVFALFCWICFFGGGSFLMACFQAQLSRVSPGSDAKAPQREVATTPGLTGEVSTADAEELRLLAAKLQAEVDGLRMERLGLTKQRDELEFQLDSIRQRVGESFAVEMIGRDFVTFRNGYRYSVGERIDWGPYEGGKIVLVDWRRRVARLEDGTLLRMGDPNSTANVGLFGSFLGQEGSAELPGSLPAGSSGGTQPRSSEVLGTRTVVDRVGGGNAAPQVPSLGEQRSGRVSDRRGEFGRPASNR